MGTPPCKFDQDFKADKTWNLFSEKKLHRFTQCHLDPPMSVPLTWVERPRVLENQYFDSHYRNITWSKYRHICVIFDFSVNFVYVTCVELDVFFIFYLRRPKFVTIKMTTKIWKLVMNVVQIVMNKTLNKTLSLTLKSLKGVINLGI